METNNHNVPKIPRFKDHGSQVATVFQAVQQHFEGDYHKALAWMQTPNPMLGDVSPAQMIRNGRYNKLVDFIEAQFELNQTPEAAQQ